MITQEELKNLFNYCAETGVFTRLKSVSNNTNSGDIAGSMRQDGYCVISVNNKSYLAHRLAWLYNHGIWPANMIDHINRNPSDNRLSNLREATRSENGFNAKIRSHNTSGFKGVTFNKIKNKWVAQCSLNKKTIQLGKFKTAELASLAYQAFAKKQHGEFYQAQL